MENTAIELINEFLTAVQTSDFEKVGSLLHPEIEWNQPGNNAVSGIKTTAAEVFDMVGKMFALSNNTLVLTDIKTLAVNGNSVACLVHWQASGVGGKTLSVDNIDVYTIENNKIVKAVVYTAAIDEENAFWGSKVPEMAQSI